MNWDIIIKYLPRLFDGAVLSLELVAIAVLAGLILAIPIGIARASRHWYIRALPYGYMFFFRGTPLLVQLFLVYYGLAQFDAVRQGPLWPILRDPFWCATITMTLHTAAYIAEILRGAIQAIPAGELEAARALGMSKTQTLFFIPAARHPHRPAGVQQRSDSDAQGQRPGQHHYLAGADRHVTDHHRPHLSAG